MTSSQGALLLTRYCAGFAKLVYSMRTVPPGRHADALERFDKKLRETTEAIIGDPLPDRCWRLAQLGIKHGGLGLRGTAQHAAAAYVAFVMACFEKCQEIDSHFDSADAAGGLQLAQSQQQILGSVLSAAQLVVRFF